jgi:hypothetical protein
MNQRHWASHVETFFRFGAWLLPLAAPVGAAPLALLIRRTLIRVRLCLVHLRVLAVA